MRTQIKSNDLITQRREQIAAGALKLFVKQGFDHTNVDDIAEACYLAVGSLYRYVGAKEDILYLAMDHYIKGANQTWRRMVKVSSSIPAKEAVAYSIKILCEFHDKTRDATVFIYHESRNLSPKHRKQLFAAEEKRIAALAGIFIKGCQDGEFEIRYPHIFAHNIVTIAEMWAVRRWYLGRRQKLQEYIEDLTDEILKSIIKR